MAMMNVSLPHPMKEWVEAQAKTGRYSNASDCVRDLIRKDPMRCDKIAANDAHAPCLVSSHKLQRA